MTSIIAEIVAKMIISVALYLLIAFPVMIFWNDALVPAIDGVNRIDWIQAWLLMILVSLLTRTEVSFSDKTKVE